MTTESMIIDTDNFDFLSLDDVVEDKNELGYNTKQTGKDLVDAEDLADDEEVDDLPDDEDGEGDEEESEEDESEEESDDEDGEAEITDEDGEEVDFEGYEVTLPTGETVVLSEVVKGYKNAQALEEERTEFNRLQTEFGEKSGSVTRMLELAQLEADKVIEDYEDFDWSAYKKDDPVGYVENREFLDRYKQRRVEIQEAFADIEAKREATEKAEFTARAKEAGTVLARDIPGWNNDMYQQLMVYAIENGANPDEIANTVDPVIFKVLHKAMQYEKGKQTVKAKVKKLGSPQKVVKAAPKAVTQTGSVKKAVIKKMESGNMSEKDLSDSFAYLED